MLASVLNLGGAEISEIAQRRLFQETLQEYASRQEAERDWSRNTTQGFIEYFNSVYTLEKSLETARSQVDFDNWKRGDLKRYFEDLCENVLTVFIKKFVIPDDPYSQLFEKSSSFEVDLMIANIVEKLDPRAIDADLLKRLTYTDGDELFLYRIDVSVYGYIVFRNDEFVYGIRVVQSNAG